MGLSFDWQYNAGLIAAHLEAADQFIATAEDAVRQSRLQRVGGQWEHRTALRRPANTLQDLRGPARYLERPLDLDADGAREMLGTLKDMREHVHAVAPNRDLDAPPRPPRVMTVVAAEDLEAGVPVKLIREEPRSAKTRKEK